MNEDSLKVYKEYLQYRFGLSPQEPTNEQIETIRQKVENLEDLEDTVKNTCKTYGSWKYSTPINIELRNGIL